MDNQDAIKVLVIVKKVETLNMGSDGSTTWGLATLKKLGGSMPNKREPIGPAMKPTINRATTIMNTGTRILIEQPVFII